VGPYSFSLYLYFLFLSSFFLCLDLTDDSDEEVEIIDDRTTIELILPDGSVAAF
jgi:hypothetical protein